MRLLLADDHVMFREALIEYIKALKPDWAIDVVQDFDEAFDKVHRAQVADHSYDLVLLDLRMPGMNGMDGLEKMIQTYPDVYTSILSGVAEEHHVKKAMAMGARAYFPKTLSVKTLVKGISLVVYSDQKFVPMDDTGTRIMPAYFDDFSFVDKKQFIKKEQQLTKGPIAKLTPKEKDVLRFLAKGLANKDIAQRLSVQIPTIKLHVGSICKKLDVQNRTQAAVIAHQSGFVDGFK